MMPRSSGGSSLPSMVNDLPVPVWPYAKMVPGRMGCRLAGLVPAMMQDAQLLHQPSCTLLCGLFQAPRGRTVVAVHDSIDDGARRDVEYLLLVAVPVIHLGRAAPTACTRVVARHSSGTGQQHELWRQVHAPAGSRTAYSCRWHAVLHRLNDKMQAVNDKMPAGNRPHLVKREHFLHV